MRSIISYAYVGGIIKKMLPLYGDWLGQNARSVAIDLREKKGLDQSATATVIGRMASSILSSPQVDFPRHAFVFDCRKATSGGTPPEMVSQTFLPIDLAQLRGANKALDDMTSIQSGLDGKLIINASGVISSSGSINNLSGFQKMIVRDYLSRTFFCDADVWVNWRFTLYMSQIYSIAIGDTLGMSLILDMETLSKVRLLFALYFIVQSTGKVSGGAYRQNLDAALGLLKQGGRDIAPGFDDMRIAEICDVFGRLVEEKSTKGDFTFADVIELLGMLGSERLSKSVSLPFIQQQNARLVSGANVIESWTAIEYPPMFAYAVLCSMSGAPGRLAKLIKDNNAVRRIVTNLGSSLKTPSVYIRDLTPTIGNHGSSQSSPSKTDSSQDDFDWL